MSYKAAVLYDYPIAYYPLDDLTTVDLVENYTDILAEFTSYQDILDNVSSYANLYGDIAYDHSGCENDGLYIGDPLPDLMPIVAGNSRCTKITNENSLQFNLENDYTATATTSQFGTASSSDNDFTIEFWFYPSFSTTNITPIVADDSNNVGVFYDKGNILFRLNNTSLSYTLPFTKKVFHVVCIYTISNMYIYIDGSLKASKPISNFIFTNSSVSFASGPTLNASDYFLINSVAFYRYALSKPQIDYHLYESQGLPPVQIAAPDAGEVFDIYDNQISTVFNFSYPESKTFDQIVKEGLTYYEVGEYLQMTQTDSVASSTVIIDDYISVPTTLEADSSKIEWSGDNGISVSISTDGSTYTSCTNGQQIPGYTLNSFGTLGALYIRITFTSSDTTKYLPKLYKLSVSFYNNQKIFAENGLSYISTFEGDGSVSDYNIAFGSKKYQILSRNDLNGVRTVTDSGFHIVTENSVRTLEMFYTPSSLNDSGLVNTSATNGFAASNYSWRNTGTISKTNISAIYVNGVDKTSETNISNVFRQGQMHHVIIVFGSAVSGEIKFNYSLFGSVSSLYQYLAIYPDAFSSGLASDHYDYYIRRESAVVNDTTTITVTEDAVNTYDNDWVVIKNV